MANNDPYENDPCIEGNEYLLRDYNKGYRDGWEAAKAHSKAEEDNKRNQRRAMCGRIIND